MNSKISTDALNQILNRTQIIKDVTKILSDFESNCHNLNYKKGIYIYGSPGCGKTQFVKYLLESLNYDIIKYDAGDVRNKNLIDTITCNNVSNRNVLSLMNRQKKPIAIVMDEIDEMNNGDKRGITSLIKLIRQKKTKKQKQEHVTLNPIICIGNNFVDKKMKELKKVCNVFELKPPNREQMQMILQYVAPIKDQETKSMILDFLQGDMRKLLFIENMYTNHPDLLEDRDIIDNIFHIKTYNDDAKKITHKLIDQYVPLEQHNQILNETDRTIISLLYHENIIDMLPRTGGDGGCGSGPHSWISFYNTFLDNLCFSDYIDRITFQNQIWIFNEMSSMIKTFYNNWLYHRGGHGNRRLLVSPEDIRFTKVLTKYSTEYNNQLFLFNVCQEMDMDKKDVIAFFQELRLFIGASTLGGMINNKSGNVEIHDQIENILQSTDINKLDIKRMYRFLDKNSDTFDCIRGKLVTVENSAHVDGFESDEEME